MKILKFGGSSVKNQTNILKVVNILKTQYETKGQYAVVVSAFGGITDLLIEMSDLASKGKVKYKNLLAQFKKRHQEVSSSLLSKSNYKKIQKELLANHNTLEDLLRGIFLVQECSPRTMDYVLSFGERNSAFIISNVLVQEGIKSKYLDARKVIVTDKTFGNASVNLSATNKKIRDHFKVNKEVQLITGFISSDKGGLTTTLGRGGSDYTASIIAGALSAKKLEIWTDVDGVLTSDPRKVKKAFTVDQISYREAMELSHFGAKVIYPPTIQPALKKNIPIYIRNTFNPSFAGTLINKQTKNSKAKDLTGLSSMSGIALIRLQGSGMVGIPGIAARLFSALASKKINVILITQASSEYSICFAIKKAERMMAKAAIEKEFEREINEGLVQKILIENELSVVAIVSEQMRHKPGVAGKLFTALGKEGINVIAIAQGSSELNISFVIKTEDEEKAMNLIHDSFFLSQEKDIHLFMIGTGLIGGTLLQQIKQHNSRLIKEHQINIKLMGVSNSRKMIIKNSGIGISRWEADLNKSKRQADLDSFIQKMIALNLPNSIFIDNTGNEQIPKKYEEVLSNNISIVTPNKIAPSSQYENYKKLKDLARTKNVSFLYETNVGAGLPVISTIENLISSGDKILKLEAVLSGTISYIFNSFNSKHKFSDVVKKAKLLGLTEPDPRDDLGGKDVKRKITILAREAGYKVNMSDVKLENILDKKCLNAKSINGFFEALKGMDKQLLLLTEKAEAKNKKLRYIATMQNGKCKVSLNAVDSNSPFYNLEGSDNMLVISTKRYNERPLVIKGPGAGAEVTAAGVFAEIISVANKAV